MGTNDDIDRVIDDVVQEMMRADPPASLRAAVMARIEIRRAPRVRWAVGSAWAGALAAAAGLVLALVFSRQPPPVDAPIAEAGAQVDAAAPGALPASSAAGGRGAAAPQRPAAAIATRLMVPRRATAAAVTEVAPVDEPFPGALPVLGAPEPIQVEALEPEPIQLEALSTEPVGDPAEIEIPDLPPGSPAPHAPDRDSKERER